MAAASAKADAEKKRSTGKGSAIAALLMCYAKSVALQVMAGIMNTISIMQSHGGHRKSRVGYCR